MADDNITEPETVGKLWGGAGMYGCQNSEIHGKARKVRPKVNGIQTGVGWETFPL